MSDKPHVYEQDGRIIYRASALGGSFHCLVAARMGYEPIAPPAAMLEKFIAGHDLEPVVLKALEKDDDWYVYDHQKEVAVQVTQKIYVVGRIDAKGARYRDGSLVDARVVEVKTQSAGEYDAYREDWSAGLFPRYGWQTSCYQIAEGLGLLLVRFNRDTEEYAVDFVDSPRHSLSEIRRRVLAVEAQAARGELPSDSCTDYPCPFFYTHVETDRVEVEDPQIEQLAREYKQAQADEKAAKGRKKATFQTLKLAAGKERKLLTANDWKITFFDARNPQKSLQPTPGIETLIAAYGLAIVEPFKLPTYSERVKITQPKEDE